MEKRYRWCATCGGQHVSWPAVCTFCGGDLVDEPPVVALVDHDLAEVDLSDLTETERAELVLLLRAPHEVPFQLDGDVIRFPATRTDDVAAALDAVADASPIETEHVRPASTETRDHTDDRGRNAPAPTDTESTVLRRRVTTHGRRPSAGVRWWTAFTTWTLSRRPAFATRTGFAVRRAPRPERPRHPLADDEPYWPSWAFWRVVLLCGLVAALGYGQLVTGGDSTGRSSGPPLSPPAALALVGACAAAAVITALLADRRRARRR